MKLIKKRIEDIIKELHVDEVAVTRGFEQDSDVTVAFHCWDEDSEASEHTFSIKFNNIAEDYEDGIDEYLIKNGFRYICGEESVEELCGYMMLDNSMDPDSDVSEVNMDPYITSYYVYEGKKQEKKRD